MKIKQNTNTTFETIGIDEGNSIEYGINANKFSKVIALFFQYSDPIGSLVREITSNARDAVKEAEDVQRYRKSNLLFSFYPSYLNESREYLEELDRFLSNWRPRPVELSLEVPANIFSDEDAKLIVRDRGIGFSESRIVNIFSKFFETTKDSSDNQIGAFGLGSKSPLGYTNMYQINTWHLGVKTSFLVHKEDKAPKITLVEKQNEDGYGSEFIIPIKRTDVEKVKNAVKTQLAYFDQVEFRGLDVEPYNVIRGENFIIRSDCPFDQTHMVLERIAYPLNMNVLGWQKWIEGFYGTPMFGIFVPLKESNKISITWNREALEYDDDTIRFLEVKNTLAKEEITDLWVKEVEDKISNLKALDLVKKTSTFEDASIDIKGITIRGWDASALQNTYVQKIYEKSKFNTIRHIKGEGIIFSKIFPLQASYTFLNFNSGKLKRTEDKWITWGNKLVQYNSNAHLRKVNLQIGPFLFGMSLSGYNKDVLTLYGDPGDRVVKLDMVLTYALWKNPNPDGTYKEKILRLKKASIKKLVREGPDNLFTYNIIVERLTNTHPYYSKTSLKQVIRLLKELQDQIIEEQEFQDISNYLDWENDEEFIEWYKERTKLLIEEGETKASQLSFVQQYYNITTIEYPSFVSDNEIGNYRWSRFECVFNESENEWVFPYHRTTLEVNIRNRKIKLDERPVGKYIIYGNQSDRDKFNFLLHSAVQLDCKIPFLCQISMKNTKIFRDTFGGSHIETIFSGQTRNNILRRGLTAEYIKDMFTDREKSTIWKMGEKYERDRESIPRNVKSVFKACSTLKRYVGVDIQSAGREELVKELLKIEALNKIKTRKQNTTHNYIFLIEEVVKAASFMRRILNNFSIFAWIDHSAPFSVIQKYFEESSLNNVELDLFIRHKIKQKENDKTHNVTS